jgi:uncharacterized membrane protein
LKGKSTRDLKKYASQTQNRMLIGLFGLCVFIGLGLIWLIYGSNAALFGMLCLTGGILVVLAILLILNLIDRIYNNA